MKGLPVQAASLVAHVKTASTASTAQRMAAPVAYANKYEECPC
ncbi:hypothetical protein NIASO_01260 [Niabella soli DSM 19437]|uniref:Uncharacterized protein n=1 Tax=Niabella soli DSM 19437 TaxID=929713 RepID=W0F5H4_9BACT|nr:hypothetical protein NIASO_01260 [Niabella soli DSM 19437]